MKLVEFQGTWLPRDDTHFPRMLEHSAKFYRMPTYQIDKLLACLPHIRQFRHAVDAGAHCGLWSRVLVRCFRMLTAFEPIPLHAECWRRNVTEGNAVLHQMALGDGSVDRLKMVPNVKNSGLAYVNAEGSVEVPARSIDQMGLPHVDFMKLDCEGYEVFVVKGGEATIRRDKPCLMVEQTESALTKYGNERVVPILQSWGAQVRFMQGNDFCLSW